MATPNFLGAKLLEKLTGITFNHVTYKNQPEIITDMIGGQVDVTLDFAPIVRQVVDGLQTLARDRGVEINVVLPHDPLIVLGDRDELIRALENLVENALKYGAAGKRVDLTVTRAQTRAGSPEARVAVRDYGPGIAPEHLPRLTERFYRVDVTDSRSQGGTGLGLALAQR